MARKRRSGVGLKSAVALLAVIAAALGSFAVPVPSWRAGEVERRQASYAEVPSRLWIDTNAACGHGRRADPDDCLAVLGIARSDGIEIAGVSTIFGNAELAVADRTTRGLAHRLTESGIALPEIATGATPDLFASAHGE
jgi:purine nucleosidase